MPRVDVSGEWPYGGSIAYGRNKRQHGGEFYLQVAGGDIASLRIPEKDRKTVARLLRRFAGRLEDNQEKAR